MKNYFKKLKLSSKALLAVLIPTLLLTWISAYVVFAQSKLNFTNSSYEHLQTLKNIQSQRVSEYFIDLEKTVDSISRLPIIKDAIYEFQRAFEQLNDKSITEKQTIDIKKFYKETEKYLQYYFI
jgi:hypothetical protein